MQIAKQTFRPQVSTEAPVAAAPVAGSPPPAGPQPAVMPRRPSGPVICPRPVRPLTEAQLQQVAGVGGQHIAGRGTLRGELKILTPARGCPSAAKLLETVVLITSGAGTRSQVSFALDVKADDVRHLVGHHVMVDGFVEKRTPYAGSISGAKLLVKEPNGREVGSTYDFKGTVRTIAMMGIGGEAPPMGNYLVLDKAIEVNGQEVTQLFLGESFNDGDTLHLYGRLDQHSFGGVEVRKGTYYSLSGISNVSAGEPRYDGKGFTSSVTGKPLEVLSYNRPMMYDAPAVIFVLDQGSDTAYVGRRGGFIPAERNPFHGFVEARSIRTPSSEERRAVDTSSGTPVSVSTGKPLEIISKAEEPASFPDAMSSTWWYDADADKAYRFSSGGIAGFMMFMDQVIE